ncbi:MAG TPA: ABC transporter permease [Acidimicrobiales bacterium]|jgi:ABC-2 type transport system permease protein|nr:ABC transporter permease [Acidimicrobiales bacterium]
MRPFVRQTWALTRRYLTQMEPAFIFISLVQPIIWLLLFGALFKEVVRIPGFGGDSYITFLTPGVVVMTALFSAGWSGMNFIDDMDSGVMSRMLVSPVHRGAMMASTLVYQALTTVVQSIIIVLLGWALGAKFPSGVPGVTMLVLGAVLIAVAFAALSNGLSLVTRTRETLIAAATALVLPLSFLSFAFMQANLVPGWIAGIARYNPVNWAVEAGRSALAVHVYWGTVGSYVLFLLASAIVAGVLATRAFRSYQRSI